MNGRPLRLHPGADLRRALETLAAREPEAAGFVVSGIGSLESPRLRFAGQAHETALPGPHEALSLAGTLKADGAHLHVVVADQAGRVCGGHLCHGSLVRTTMEVLLACPTGWQLARELDPATGYGELRVRPVPGASPMPSPSSPGNLLLIGASRGLGLALADEYLRRGWQVVATERAGSRSRLHDLAAGAGDRLVIETVDIVFPEQVAALRASLASRSFDLLFVNAGVTNDHRETIADVSTEEFVRIMVTNALSPLRVVEALQDLVRPRGTIAIMSSGQGSIANNDSGRHEVYRGSKAALNMFMRSYAARHAQDARTLLLMAPGWVRTDLGGPDARLGIEDSIPHLVDTLAAQAGRPGLQFLDYLGRTLPW